MNNAGLLRIIIIVNGSGIVFIAFLLMTLQD
jgi:hypothetical protein